MSKLQDNGIDSLPYYGEMDAKSRYSNYMKWKNDEIKVTVATSAFGMGIDKNNIHRVVRYGVPESLTNWAQELAGMDIQLQLLYITVWITQTMQWHGYEIM